MPNGNDDLAKVKGAVEGTFGANLKPAKEKVKPASDTDMARMMGVFGNGKSNGRGNGRQPKERGDYTK